MEKTKLAENAIVLDVLAEDNYEIWKVSLKSYLLERDLWDIVNRTEYEPNATQVEFKTWRMKNTKALHAIRMSCGPQMLSHINEINSAKVAWDHLASTHQPPSVEGILASETELSSTAQGEMETTKLAKNAIVLAEDNYEIWKVSLKSYLLEGDLWDIVNGTESEPNATQVEFKTWRMKNTKALHAIRMSCGPQILSHINEINSAKVAWDHLASTHQPPSVEGILASETKVSSTAQGEMEKTKFAENAIVLDVLAEDNYEIWKVSLKSYLLEGDLWDIVNGTESEPNATQAEFKTWRMKNAKALHAIRMSCGPQILSHINEINSAKAAWDHLASTHQPPSVEGILASETEVSSTAQGIANNDYSWSLPLFKAVYCDDWKSAKKFIDLHPGIESEIVTSSGETALHIAAVSGHVGIVEELVKLMPRKSLELRNTAGVTALHLAALSGITKIAEVIVKKNETLLGIRTNQDMIPVVMASSCGHKHMVRYLYSLTPKEELNPETSTNGVSLLTYAIVADIYDVALELLQLYPRLASNLDYEGDSAVCALAQRSSAFPSGSIKQIFDRKLMNIQALEVLNCICKEISTLDDSQLKKIKAYSAVLEAAKYGNIEFIIEIIKHYPRLMWSIDESNNRGLFFTAIVHRQEKVFNLIYGIGTQKNEIIASWDIFHNNGLHLAGMLSPASQLARVSGAALQMQRELQWFKEVESLVQPKLKEGINMEEKTPRALFTEAHKELLKEGEKWMKDTASSSMVVAALIATVMFTAAFTVPGGNNGNTGTPIFLGHNSFMVYIVSDALSLFSSATSVLMFLGILTSRYAEDDFLKTLPRRLIIGLATLFFSIVTMMIAFGATLFIVLRDRLSWVAIPVYLMACVPITLFASLQFPLLVDMIYSTYGPGIFNRKTKRWNY
ncbi:hypothetical protein HHK36_030526 [Tetracentron sinense]|uniref:PGG domain-containing protein n=1 Tax=Tetracentron sinense TaxID=13715 RepID=A0A834Y7N5_TETSI|nr:hypothetical protein HHK36_030526 [Tetracentron sinense]